MSLPVISVVMPVFNGERFLEQALDSVLCQTWPDFELIVVDDGSSDSTPQILERVSSRDDRVVPARLTSNQGVTAALNHGVRLARGEFIARMDSDDVCMPERFARQLQFMRQHPGVAVLGSSVEGIDEDGRVIEGKQYPREPHMVAWSMYFFNSLAHPATIIRKAAINQARCYPDAYLGAEDYGLFIGLARQHELANLGEPLLRYRRWGGSVSRDARQLSESVRVVYDALGAVGVSTTVDAVSDLLGLARGALPPSVERSFQLASLIEVICGRHIQVQELTGSQAADIRRNAGTRLWQISVPLLLRGHARVASAIMWRAVRLSPVSFWAAAMRLLRR